MKALICIGSLRETGLWPGLQGIPMALLPIAGKPIIEYYADFCSSLALSEILILDSDYSSEVARFIGDGSRWSVKMQYRGASRAENLRKLRQRHAGFLGEDDFLCISGLVFPVSNYQNIIWSDVSAGIEHGLEEVLDNGLYCFQAGKLFTSSIPILTMQNYAHYFACNMYVLQAEKSHYPLPGYHVEEGVYTGMGLVFPASCQIKAPAVIGNHVRMKEKVELLGNVILGNYVMIDSQSTMQDVIVIDNTYVGRDLEIKNKIICRNKIIDPDTGIVLRLDDDRLLLDARRFAAGRFLLRVVDYILSILLLLWLTPWLLLFQLLFRTKYVRESFYGAQGRRHQYLAFSPQQCNQKNLYYYKLMLDKYFLLPYVLSGNLALLGQSRYIYAEVGDTNFRPGVFSFSETRAGIVAVAQLEIDDLYFKRDQGLFNTIRSLKRIAINRLLASMEEMQANAKVYG